MAIMFCSAIKSLWLLLVLFLVGANSSLHCLSFSLFVDTQSLLYTFVVHISSMKSLTIPCILLSLAVAVHAIPARNHKGAPAPAAAAQDTSTSTTNLAAGSAGAITQGPSTLVLFEVNGVPGNECLTFRNNGTSHRPLQIPHRHITS